MITEVAVSQQVWAGVDAGKSDHHCVAIDAEGQRLLSQRVANDETALLGADRRSSGAIRRR